MNEPKRLAKGTMTDTIATVYTVPSGKKAAIKAISISNKTVEDREFSLMFDGEEFPNDHTILANDMITIPYLDQIMEAGEAIEVVASANDAVNYWISGKEFDA